MSRAKKVRAVYFELRRVFGFERPAFELIQAAALIVAEFFRDDAGGSLEPARSPPLYSMAIDEAFADGGWRVLTFERSQNQTAYSEIEGYRDIRSAELKWQIGNVQWPRPTEMG